LSVQIHGKTYTLNCAPEQKAHLMDLVQKLNARMDPIANRFGHAGENHILVLTCLTLLDELQDEASRNISTLEEKKLRQMLLRVEALAQSLKEA
jgi:cell division protein ZapA